MELVEGMPLGTFLCLCLMPHHQRPPSPPSPSRIGPFPDPSAYDAVFVLAWWKCFLHGPHEATRLLQWLLQRPAAMQSISYPAARRMLDSLTCTEHEDPTTITGQDPDWVTQALEVRLERSRARPEAGAPTLLQRCVLALHFYARRWRHVGLRDDSATLTVLTLTVRPLNCWSDVGRPRQETLTSACVQLEEAAAVPSVLAVCLHELATSGLLGTWLSSLLRVSPSTGHALVQRIVKVRTRKRCPCSARLILTSGRRCDPSQGCTHTWWTCCGSAAG